MAQYFNKLNSLVRQHTSVSPQAHERAAARRRFLTTSGCGTEVRGSRRTSRTPVRSGGGLEVSRPESADAEARRPGDPGEMAGMPDRGLIRAHHRLAQAPLELRNRIEGDQIRTGDDEPVGLCAVGFKTDAHDLFRRYVRDASLEAHVPHLRHPDAAFLEELAELEAHFLHIRGGDRNPAQPQGTARGENSSRSGVAARTADLLDSLANRPLTFEPPNEARGGAGKGYDGRGR